MLIYLRKDVKIQMDVQSHQHFMCHMNGLTTAKYKIFMQVVMKLLLILYRKYIQNNHHHYLTHYLSIKFYKRALNVSLSFAYTQQQQQQNNIFFKKTYNLSKNFLIFTVNIYETLVLVLKLFKYL